MRVKAVLFDAYGTLFDVHSVVALAESYFPGSGAALSHAWRSKQLEYTWLRTLSDRYRDFWQVTGDALTWAGAALELRISAAQHAQLMNAYLELKAFPENLEVLHRLHKSGLTLGTLSNGTTAMLEAALSSAAMRDLVTHVLSVDAVRCFKTDPRAYALGTAAIGAPAGEIGFVSSNCWDAIGATWYGYRTFWVNRARTPLERLDVVPAGTGATLHELLPFFE